MYALYVCQEWHLYEIESMICEHHISKNAENCLEVQALTILTCNILTKQAHALKALNVASI